MHRDGIEVVVWCIVVMQDRGGGGVGRVECIEMALRWLFGASSSRKTEVVVVVLDALNVSRWH
jgi:hypothetical protein